MPVDLHLHTTASDGELAPSEVVRIAARAALLAIAITDHDTTDGLDEALRAGADSATEVLSGVELSVDEATGSDVHVLGLLVDHRDLGLNAALAGLRDEREERARAMVEALARAGYPIDVDSVREIAGSGSIGRVHIARALVSAGSASTIEAAFGALIGRDAPFYFRKRTLRAAEAIDVIHGAGGVAVLAHPGVSGEEALPELLTAGIDGVEAYHAEHTAFDRERFLAVAAANGLIVTGGSDFHAADVRSAPIGGGGCPDDAVEALRRRAARYRS
jgi:predicted metal-dependent phosphoesterase TrpH